MVREQWFNVVTHVLLSVALQHCCANAPVACADSIYVLAFHDQQALNARLHGQPQPSPV